MSSAASMLQSERGIQSLVMLELLEKVLSPLNSSASQLPLLISIDLESDSSSSIINQAGFAILDTANITQSVLEPVISSRLILLGQHKLPRNHCTRQYLFGTPEDGVNKNLQDLIFEVMMPVGTPLNLHQDIILLGHNIAADIRAIKAFCGLNIQSLRTIIAVIDTADMPALIFNLQPRQISLKETCKLLHIKARQLHNAGNDAMYTMQVVLLLFRKFMDNKSTAQKKQTCWVQRLNLLEQVVRNVSYAPKLPKQIRDSKPRCYPSDIMESNATDTGIASIFDQHIT